MDPKRKSDKVKRHSKVMEANFWDCSVCTYRNNAEAFKCSMCDVRKGKNLKKNLFLQIHPIVFAYVLFFF